MCRKIMRVHHDGCPRQYKRNQKMTIGRKNLQNFSQESSTKVNYLLITFVSIEKRLEIYDF